jgi:hypothetical protein
MIRGRQKQITAISGNTIVSIGHMLQKIIPAINGNNSLTKGI